MDHEGDANRTDLMTITRFVLNEQSKYAESRGDFTILISHIVLGCKFVCSSVNKVPTLISCVCHSTFVHSFWLDKIHNLPTMNFQVVRVLNKWSEFDFRFYRSSYRYCNPKEKRKFNIFYFYFYTIGWIFLLFISYDRQDWQKS
jgi:hypothetical protein